MQVILEVVLISNCLKFAKLPNKTRRLAILLTFETNNKLKTG